MNIWAFLFYTLVIVELSINFGEFKNEDSSKSDIAGVIILAVIGLFIYMGWYQ